ncbi:H+-transporting ATPase [Thermoflexales bacterium]|nr:H+-transporting ATPase [Thermoflexales bacterium]
MASSTQTLEVPIAGMDCTECTLHVQHAIAALPGVDQVDVFLASEKAIVRFDPAQVDLLAISDAVKGAGYRVPDRTLPPDRSSALQRGYSRQVLTLFGVVFFAVLFIVVIGEGLGVFARLTELIPWPIWSIVIVAAGLPIFRNVIRATLHRQVISHTLMTLGMLAAVAVGEWATAAIVVFFMRVGDYAERFTTERARRAVKDLTALAPQTARLEENGVEHEVPIGQVQPGDVIIVRPGEKIPVDGEVIDGQATIDQATITGESLPVEAGPGVHVYAATFARLGSLRLRTIHVGSDTTFGRVIKLVEEAEAQRADVQRVADKFSAYYLPVVAGIAALTFLISRDPLATCAVLVVACSCSFALATPIAMLASIGAAAKHGLLIKGGKYLEALAQADVLLIDKTGTLTLGQPQIVDQVAYGISLADLLQLAASVERYSEHPLAQAVRAAAQAQNIPLLEPHDFEALPGLGVRARINGSVITVGNRRFIGQADTLSVLPDIERLEAQGQTLLYVTKDGQLNGVLAAADTLRPEVPAAIEALRSLGLHHIELLTGDNERTAATLAQQIGVSYRANLLPENKIAIVKEYQAQGHVVIMVGDGVNDAPALAQANIGLAMGAAGSDVAIEAAHIALLRDDWTLVPRVLQIARRTMRVVKSNLGFTIGYNAIGLTLAALGYLPPVLAAAAQSLPDIGILANSSRLIRQK